MPAERSGLARYSGWLRALAFVAITMPLTWLWMNGGQDAYMAFFKQTATPLFKLLGVTNYPPSAVRDRFIGFVPFIALMLITPGLEWRRRIGGILLGFPVIVLCQIALVYAVFVIVVDGDGWNEQTKTALFPFQVMFDAVPLLLWAIFAHEYLGSLLQKIIPPTPVPPPAAPAESTPEPAPEPEPDDRA